MTRRQFTGIRDWRLNDINEGDIIMSKRGTRFIVRWNGDMKRWVIVQINEAAHPELKGEQFVLEKFMQSEIQRIGSMYDLINEPVYYFKRHQHEGVYHYYEVHGGPGRNPKGYQIVINFLNDFPVVMIEHNDISHPTGTWCQFEAGERISKEEFIQQYKLATDHPNVEFY